MYKRLKTYSLFGLDVQQVEVEVSISPGLPKLDLIGLPDAAMRESKNRILRAIESSGYELPPGQITINLAPAELPKRGSHYDLPMALGILLATGQVKGEQNLENIYWCGELSLDGRLKSAGGLFNFTCSSLAGSDISLVFPRSNLLDIESRDKLSITPCESLAEVCSKIHSDSLIPQTNPELPPLKAYKKNIADYGDIFGQEMAKRAMQMAAAAGLNVLLIGPPGCGKSMLIKRLPGLLEALNTEDSRECSAIHNVAGTTAGGRVYDPPFREVLPTVSDAALMGGGHLSPLPGEISLAHHGFLFLDELGEFNKKTLQLLRTPLETGKVHISRARYKYTFPSKFTLLAASNPCPCGFHGDRNRTCSCGEKQINSYYQKLSGPLLDRIDILLYLQSPKQNELFLNSDMTTASMAKDCQRVKAYLQSKPFFLANEQLQRLIKEKRWLKEVLTQTYKSGLLSLRRLNNLLKVALVLSLFEGEELQKKHIYQSLEYSRIKWPEDTQTSLKRVS